MILFKYLILTLTLSTTYAYKFLVLFTLPTGSHNILATKLFNELAIKGHEVTVFTPFSQKNPPKRLKEITIKSLIDIFPLTQVNMMNKENLNPLEKAIFGYEFQYDASKTLLESKELQTLLKSDEKFDAVILYYYLNEALLGVAHHFNVPVILFASMPLYASESFLLSHPIPTSYTPNILTEYTGRMNFWQRLRNSFYDVLMIIYFNWFMLPQHQELAQKYLPKKPNIYNLLGNESIILINSHVSTNEATPFIPNAIEIGGFHISDPKPLSPELQNYMDNSTNGVILFSMGSILKSKDFPEEKINEILKSLSKLRENVLWKYEDEHIKNLPKNVKIMKWIPQSDVLSHRNIKAFISHGGLLSTMESVYHGVPIIGIPIAVDQKMNMEIAASHDYAIKVSYQELSEEKLTVALEQILQNPKYKENIRIRSKIMRDRPIKPIDNALYWIEYVVRHQGAAHLRYPGKDLNWLQKNLIDVAAFVFLLAILPLIALKMICKRFCSKTKQKTD